MSFSLFFLFTVSNPAFAIKIPVTMNLQLLEMENPVPFHVHHLQLSTLQWLLTLLTFVVQSPLYSPFFAIQPVLKISLFISLLLLKTSTISIVQLLLLSLLLGSLFFISIHFLFTRKISTSNRRALDQTLNYADLLSHDVELVIYFDPDLIVVNDVVNLWNIDPNVHALGAPK